MRALVLTKHGGPGVWQQQERPDPELGPAEVRIEVAACGVNFADVMARMGIYPDGPKPPCIVGYEVAGTVSEVGPDVEHLTPGQRVLSATRFGGYASEVAVPAGDLLVIPERLSFEQAAAIPVNYATAWAALIGYGSLRAGERVLILSAGGGVGVAAVQIAKRFGADVHGAASPSKHQRIRELGVDTAIDYTKSGWEQGLGHYDLILDAAGGASLRRSYKMLRAGGRLVCYGASGTVTGSRRNLPAALATVLRTPRFSALRQMTESKSVIGLNLLRLWDAVGSLRPWLQPLAELIDDDTIQPQVAGSFGFQEIQEAHAMITERRNLGKVVLIP